ncbi:MAG: TlpA family protein disulfide reductase [Methylocella sp.]
MEDLLIGDPVPGLILGRFLKGEPVAGDVYVIEFWASWGGPCRRSIPYLTELQKKFLELDRDLKSAAMTYAARLIDDAWHDNVQGLFSLSVMLLKSEKITFQGDSLEQDADFINLALRTMNRKFAWPGIAGRCDDTTGVKRKA